VNPFVDLKGNLEGSFNRPRSQESIIKSLQGAVEAGRFGTGKRGAASLRAGVMPKLVKGYGQHRATEAPRLSPDGMPVFQFELTDGAKMDELEAFASATLRAVISKGLTKPEAVLKSFNPMLGNSLSLMGRMQAMPYQQMAAAFRSALSPSQRKNFSVGSPLASGFVPFDLVPFVRTIYPVNTKAA
jgi:hypothetical protein